MWVEPITYFLTKSVNEVVSIHTDCSTLSYDHSYSTGNLAAGWKITELGTGSITNQYTYDFPWKI